MNTKPKTTQEKTAKSNKQDKKDQSPSVAIIGAGMSGLCMAMQLKKAGIENFTIFEKSNGLGGTWHENTYPGCACDIPSHLYSYSFEPNPEWSHKWSGQREILDYFKTCADKYDISKKIKFSTEIISAIFDDKKGAWSLSAANGEHYEFKIVVFGVGQLNRPSMPAIPAIESFNGKTFHSAQWNHDIDLKGKKIACIGNGASAIQIVPEIAKTADQVTVFQRSANWILPRGDKPYSDRIKKLFKNNPISEWLYRNYIYWSHEIRYPILTQNSFFQKIATKQASSNLQQVVRDPTLLEKLTPNYPVGCKRILISDEYFPTLTRPSVNVVNSPITTATPSGLTCQNGQSYDFDIIVYATGFKSTQFLAPIDIIGSNGQSLNYRWKNGAEAYFGVMVSGFPNLFLLYGPNTNLGHNSIIYQVESQVQYVLKCIKEIKAKNLNHIDVDQSLMDEQNRKLQLELKNLVWSENCGNWYKDNSGKITNNWPGWSFQYRRKLKSLDIGLLTKAS